MAKQPRERNLSDASTTRRQRIARFIGQYVELNVRCILDRPSLEMVVAFMSGESPAGRRSRAGCCGEFHVVSPSLMFHG